MRPVMALILHGMGICFTDGPNTQVIPTFYKCVSVGVCDLGDSEFSFTVPVYQVSKSTVCCWLLFKVSALYTQTMVKKYLT